ncbi:general stress protein [Aetokthonos hydrillicola Thurmond2011]|jgi:uncharacterized protein with beta-barrel porin domain|uniref:General stress protein n=1 Tax=Aetokthonos hydrillicola Thurmond2011 TaxID=2712845 RepID=A0AAP5IFH4_9CYAN|nr:general stress protein [Aetokthonos hydrillicola]MBO3462430.1 DUF1269 domain-containing protein [Aetokthonos hydrillicola CCALA 1050]MBW4590923.1 general stress protein [Aetokthonos hydrillicola CCALA 1050]MDR9899187.1 general stress protein [Aetokthonos hydrillicola Thurmond2011]
MTFSKPSNEHKRAFGVFSSRTEAENALTKLRDAGFNMSQVSVVAKDAEREGDIAGVEMQEHLSEKAAGAAIKGAAMGGITGLIVGLGTLTIPGLAPILLVGEVATTVATAVAGAGIGSLLGALTSLGIPEERATVYNQRVSTGDYLVIVDGSEQELRHAEDTLRSSGIQEFDIYNPFGVSHSQSNSQSPVTVVDHRDGI